MSKRIVGVGVLWAGILAALALPARADVDLTGRWLLHFDYHLAQETVIDQWTQVGTALSTASGFTGTIDPMTGGFSMSAPSGGGICPANTQSGSSDGSTLAGSGVVHFLGTPTLCFSGLSYTLTGSRCDNGSVEAGEQCDDGNATDGDGCDAFCQIETCHTCTGEPSLCGPLPICCGSGVIDAAEECDDLNTSDGDGCSATCQIETCFGCGGEPSSCSPLAAGTECPSAGVCVINHCDGAGTCADPTALDCDDGSPCTNDSCSSSQGCLHEPAVQSCRSAQRSKLLVIDEPGGGARLVWKWSKGQSTSQADFSDPTTTADYDLCLFAGANSAVVGEVRVGADAQKWNLVDARGFLYLDGTGVQDGVRKLLLKGSDSDRASVVLKRKGASLVHPPLALPITVQLSNSDTGLCWGASFDDAAPNRIGKLKARSAAP